MVLPIQYADDIVQAHAVGQQLLDGGIQLGFLCVQSSFGVCAGLLGFQLVDRLLDGFERSTVGFQLCLQAVDLVEGFRNILLKLRFLRSFCVDGVSVIGGGGQLIELGVIIASFWSGHGSFLLICS